MDKIAKILNSLSREEQARVCETMERILAGNLENLDIRKLKGVDGIFRARKGKIRIIYSYQKGKPFILSVERRNENTYNF